MGYDLRQYSIGSAPVQAGAPIVVTAGDSWIEDHIIKVPPVGGFTTADAVDNVIIHVRAREDDEEPVEELTSDPAAGVVVSRPSPDQLKVRFTFTPTMTAGWGITAPDGGRIPGTPAPPEPVPGIGLMAMKVYLAGGAIFTFFRAPFVLQGSLVYGGTTP